MPRTIRYRFAHPDEVHDVARLVAHSFPGPQRTPTWWHEQLRDPLYGGGVESLFVGDISGRIVAACQVHPLREWIAGEALPTAGVGTVAISPTHRKRRLGADLVIAALRAAHERGDIASALYPFRTSFYQKLGYGQAGEALQYSIPPETLPDAFERQQVELIESIADRIEALELYNRWACTQNGQLDRSERLWTHQCTATDRALVGYRAENGELQGYALVVYRTDLPPDERYLEVDEIVWTSNGARRGLYGWLASLGDQWRRILIRALPSQRMGDWISEPRLPWGAAPSWRLWAPGATLLMGPMFRLLDMRAAWQRRRIAAAASIAITIDVTDAQLEENTGRWRLVLRDGKVAVERDAPSDATLRLDIATLSRLYIGSLSASHALAAGLLECDRPDRLATLDTALALPEPWTFDRF